ncbi:MAG: caspase family protein [Methyloceanibacter sp.]|uniref:caspase family protein n=1 Tax=Methyloceanibacter sp. TaxID=1965321 RepID=UPI003D6CBA6F
MLRPLAACIFCLGLAMAFGPASAEQRVALVIGNSAYQHTAPLKNPSNDATDMAALLRRLGFEVIDGTDLSKRDMVARIRTFADKVRGADVGLFYYAGHGLQVEGRNFLAPVDARLSSDVDLDFEAVELDLVLKQLERSSRLSLVFLDACRDNPLASNLALASRSLSVGRGLAQIEKAVGMMIAFATQPGNVALDGEGRNSPYTAALLRHISTQGSSINDVMIEVRKDVLEQTGGKQVPWENSSLTGQFFFKPGPAQAVAGGDKTAAEIAALREEIERLKAGQALGETKDRQIAVEAAGAGADTKVAAIDGNAEPQPEAPSQSTPPPLPPERTEQELAADISAELKTLGCYDGTPSADWDTLSQDALQRFNTLSKLDLPLEAPQASTLDALKAWKGGPCPATKVVAPTPKPDVAPKAAPKKQAAPTPQPKTKKTVKQPAATPKAAQRKKPADDGISDAQRELQRAFPSTNWPGGN